MMRALKVLIFLVLLLAAGVGALHVLSVDSAPPDDAALRPGEPRTDGRNAYNDVAMLSAQLQFTEDDHAFVGKQFDEGVSDPARIDALLARNGAPLDLLANLAARTHYEDPAFRDPAKVSPATPMPQFRSLISAARLMGLRAQRLAAERRGSDAAANALAISDAAQVFLRSRQPIVTGLTGCTLSDIGAAALHRVVTAGQADKQALADAAKRYSTYGSAAPAIQAGLQYEYLTVANFVGDIERIAQADQKNGPLLRVAGRHNFLYQRNTTVGYFADRFRPLVEESVKPCVKVNLPLFEPLALMGINPIGKSFYNVATPAFDKMLVRRCESDARRALAGLEAAIAAYRLDRGSNPPSFEELLAVGYITSVPADPYTGARIGYDPASGKLTVEGKTSDGKDLAF